MFGREVNGESAVTNREWQRLVPLQGILVFELFEWQLELWVDLYCEAWLQRAEKILWASCSQG